MNAGKVRVSAVGDIHVHEGTIREWREVLDAMVNVADVLVLCGDLTNRGRAQEAEMLADSLSQCKLPVIAVLGNHDVECEEEADILRILCAAGVIMLDDQPHEVDTVGFVGVKGFCGGFDRNALAPFGEKMIKQFVHESVNDALQLEAGLSRLRTPHKIAVLHYAPVRDTVVGEPEEIFPFLGSSRLADPIDHFQVTAAVHGHAHNGSHRGATARGIPVYNVALPLMKKLSPERPFLVLDL